MMMMMIVGVHVEMMMMMMMMIVSVHVEMMMMMMMIVEASLTLFCSPVSHVIIDMYHSLPTIR